MVRITLDMIRKKSEHNTGLLAELEELTLHQLNIEKLEVIHKHCRRLKILYLQNNYIEKIENAYKLKDLRYLNLALNSIQVIEGLRSCEKLEKLDLTVNFVSEKTLYESMENVRHNIHLHEIYFTGNPCTEAEGYRLFVIGSLARLVRLDGTDVTKTERIQAKQQYPALAKKFKSLMEKLTNDDEAYGSDDEDDGDVIEIDDKGNRKYKYTPALRRQMMKEDIEQKRLEAEKKNEPNQFTKPADPLREAQERLAKKVTEWKDGELPSQRNTSRTDYRFKKDPSGKNLLLEVEVPRYMDTSLLDVDIHPLWLQVRFLSSYHVSKASHHRHI